MAERPWQMFLLNPENMTREDGDRLLERAGFPPRLSMHVTEAEAKSAAEDALRKLREVDNTEWVACYAEPYREGPGPGRINLNPNPRVEFIRSGDIAE